MNPRTVYTVLEEAAQAYGKGPALQQPIGKGQYKTWTWPDYLRTVQEIACGLRRQGVRKGDIIALYSETRAEFYLADIGIMSTGAIAAALYTSYPPVELIKNLRASDPKIVFAENPKAMDDLNAAAGDDPLAVRWMLLTGEREGVMNLEQLCAEGRQAMTEDSQACEKMRQEVQPDDPAILYLTSGATGEPKMGIATHWAIVSNLDMGPKALEMKPPDSTIAVLPSAHIAQRIVIELIPVRLGVEVWFSESLSKLPVELKAIRPTFVLAPPRVWERIYASITTEIRKKNTLTRKIFAGAVGLGSEVARLKQAGKPVPGWMQRANKLADKAVFSKIRDRLGGKIRVAASGAAPLGKDLGEFYAAIGMPLVEGYGLTEGGVATLNPLDRPKPGSIGKLLPGVEARLEEDGELMLKSPCLFTGYLNDPAATASVLRDGWLATGDIGEIDGDGYLYITGRKKELIVSSNGKKIYPSRIEHLLKREPLISHVVLAGDRRPYVAALMTVNGPVSEAQTAVASAVKAANRELAGFEQIRKFRILERE